MKIGHIREIIKDGAVKPEGEHEIFGVMVPLIETSEGCRVLLEIRASTLKKQPGEISLPGGRKEKGETPLEAAVRETSEELTIPKTAVSVLGPLDYLVTPFNYIIYPFVGAIGQKYISDIKGAPGEVDCLFTVPLNYFLRTRPQIYRVRTEFKVPGGFPFELIPGGEDYNWSSGIYPVYFYSYNGRIIWGITARILKSLVDKLSGDVEAYNK